MIGELMMEQTSNVDHTPAEKLRDTLDALERLNQNARRVYGSERVRDWPETLAQSEAVLKEANRPWH